MANEFKHLSVGGELTQGEYEGIGAHVFDSQATGDIAYASSTTQLSRLGIGAENTTLQVSSGGIPEWVAAPTFSTGTVIGNLTLANGSITDSSGAISFGDENLTSTGVITGATVEATGDTSAGDNSALGYTSAEGAILTGQGSTSDVTIKNDADGTVISIPTGTTNVKLAESSDLMFGSNAILSDSSGTMTLSNVDALDATTEATIEGAIDTLANLTSASSLATVGTITSGTWQGTTVAVAQGGTGATTLNNLITLGTHTTGNYVTDITAGALIDVSGGGSETATVTVSVDLSELTDMTGAEAGTDELVILDAGTQKRKAINEINLSSFNDDLGYAAGDITAVTAGTGLSGGGTSGAVTVNIDFSSLTDMTGAEAGTDELVILDAGTEKRKAINEINLSSFNDDLGYASGDITAVTAGVGLSGGGTSGAVSLALDLSELSDVTPANGDKLATIDSDGSTEQLTTVASLATLFAGTGLTASSSVIGVDASQAITALTGGDLTIYEDANNADVSLKLGTSATESLTIQVLNGASNKTAEEVHFSTATASGTADHGKMVFDVDGTDIVTIDDGGLNVTSGSLETATIDYTDGDLAMTIADGGGVTFAQDVALADDKVINFGDEGQVVFTDTAPSTDHTATGVVISIASGESVAAFNAVYIRSDGEVGPADADAASTMPAIGVALEAKGDGEATKILVAGVLRDDTYNFTPGADLFIGTTAGEITATAPSGSGDTVQKIGVALTADSIYVNFNTTEVLLA